MNLTMKMKKTNKNKKILTKIMIIMKMKIKKMN